MKENKKRIIIISGIILIILVIAIVIGVIIYNKNKGEKEVDNQEEEVTSFANELQMVGDIENEEYYFNTEKEYWNASEKYEDLVAKYKDERFTDEEKSILDDYNTRAMEAANNDSKADRRAILDERSKKYQEFLEKHLSKSELNELNELNKKIDDTQSIVDEYEQLKYEVEEKRSEEGLIITNEGKIENQRSGIVNDKECNGLKLSNVKLVYNPNEKTTKLAAKITNVSDKKIEEGTMISIRFSGDTEGTYPFRLIELNKNEYMEINIDIEANLSNTNNIELIEYNEADYNV